MIHSGWLPHWIINYNERTSFSVCCPLMASFQRVPSVFTSIFFPTSSRWCRSIQFTSISVENQQETHMVIEIISTSAAQPRRCICYQFLTANEPNDQYSSHSTLFQVVRYRHEKAFILMHKVCMSFHKTHVVWMPVSCVKVMCPSSLP